MRGKQMIRAWKTENGNYFIGCMKSRRFHKIPDDCVKRIIDDWIESNLNKILNKKRDN